MKLYYFFLIFLVSCGMENDFQPTPFTQQEDPRSITSINSDFTEYYEEFIKDCRVSIDIPIDFQSLNSPNVGLCSTWSSGSSTYKQIAIDPTWWDNANEGSRKWLIYHELGHCVLNKDHNDKFTTKPESIMISTIPGAADLLVKGKFWKEYVKELCGE